MNDTGIVRFSLNCTHIEQNKKNRIDTHGFIIQVFHVDNEPPTTNRMLITRKDLEIEILPSKGFSVGKTSLNNKPVLWNAPIGLADPVSLDFTSDEISISGTPTPGFTYLRTFTGGIEFLGLTNWGMPRIDSLSGELLPLHGEVSNIPLETVEFDVSNNGLIARGTIIYRTMKGDVSELWWKRGKEMYRINKSIVIDNETPGFKLADTITNVTKSPLIPDWGYHVTFLPEPGSKLLVPSLELEARGNGSIPAEFDTWNIAKDEKIRTEIGIIHKKLKSFVLQGQLSTNILKLYPNGRAIELTVPITPYFQTWFSSGGSDSNEFTYNDGTHVFSKSWNGFGVEVGSSPLDNDGNTDKSVAYKKILEPGDQIGIMITMKLLDSQAAELLKKEIEAYNSDRK